MVVVSCAKEVFKLEEIGDLVWKEILCCVGVSVCRWESKTPKEIVNHKADKIN